MGRLEIYEKARSTRELIFSKIKDKKQITMLDLRLLLPELSYLSDTSLSRYFYDVMNHYHIEISDTYSPRGGKKIYYLNYYGAKDETRTT